MLGGTAYCLISALAFTAVNVCMRQLSAMQCDPIWAVFHRELVTTVLVILWLSRGTPQVVSLLPRGRTLARLILVGVLVQLIANLCVQWAYGIVGLAVTIPAIYGASITAGAVLGRLWLGESVSHRSMVAIALLLLSLLLLGQGAESAGRSLAGAGASEAGALWLLLVVASPGLAGVIFAMMNIAVRHSVTRTTPPVAIALLIPLMGPLCLGPICFLRLGLNPWINTSWEQLTLMTAAGVFNLIGFTGLILGLQRITVVHVNMLNAAQVAMAAVAGIALFREPPNLWLLLGVLMTIAGIIWMDKPSSSRVVFETP